MRAFVAALSLTLYISSAQAAERMPTISCSKDFVASWRADKEATMSKLPKKPCLMPSETGTYVCYKEGCVRSSAYLDQ